MTDAEQKAHAFLTQEQAFRLGDLVTESFHPKTRNLSQTLQADLEAGVRMLQSVEGFEDFPDFGRLQLREAGVQRDDVVVAITEGGETPFVIGTAWEGLAAGAHVFFVYNNPTDVLRRHVQRSREVLDEPRIQRLDLSTGPMAITGSTRMQAVTAEMLVVGAALEQALTQLLLESLSQSDGAALPQAG